MKKITLILLLLSNFAFSMDFTVFKVTSSDAFNYFFSFPVWVAILTIPVLLVFFIFRHWR